MKRPAQRNAAGRSDSRLRTTEQFYRQALTLAQNAVASEPDRSVSLAEVEVKGGVIDEYCDDAGLSASVA
jgi:hypothetical protein